MMNVVALAFLISYFSAVVVLVPEPHLTQADHRAEAGLVPPDLFRSAKGSSQDAICDNEPCPSSMDQVKDAAHRGYEKTAEGIDRAKEGVKEAVKGVYEGAKHGVQGKTEQAKEGTYEGAEKVKHGAHETAQSIQDKGSQATQGVYETAKYAKDAVQDTAGQVKDGTYETAQKAKETVQDKAGQVKQGAQSAAEKVASYVPSTEDVKQGAYVSTEKLASYIPSKEEAASYIPGVETGKDAANVVKQKVGEAKDKVSSYVEDSNPVSYSKESLDSLRSRLDEMQREAASYMQGKEKEDSYSYLTDLRKKLDEASAYLPSKEKAAALIPGMVTLEGIRRGAQESAESVQDKVRGASDGAKENVQGLHDRVRDVGDNVRDTTSSYKQSGEETAGATKGKVGGMFQGMKERFTGGPRKGRDGSGLLERRVQELCSLFGDGSEVERGPKGVTHIVSLDVAATRNSYAYLMQSALGAIERAHELFDHATEDATGAEWREKYVYLADSAKGALVKANEVFERAASAAEGTVDMKQAPSQRAFAFGKSKNMNKIGGMAIHTKERLSAAVRPLLRTLYLATFSAIYGIALWMTFLSGHLLSRTLPRQQLGVVQSKLFPVYLRMITGCIALCGIAHALLHPWWSADRPERWQYGNFALSMGLSLLNMLVVEPRATKMMFEKLKVEKEEGRGQTADLAVAGGEVITDEPVKKRIAEIDAKFRGLHQIASYLNLANVAGLTWHLWYLANRLVV